MGTESPGPGIYDVREVAHKLSTHRETGASKFGTSNRMTESKVRAAAHACAGWGGGEGRRGLLPGQGVRGC